MDGENFFTYHLLDYWWETWSKGKSNYKPFWETHISHIFRRGKQSACLLNDEAYFVGLYHRGFQHACVNFIILQRIQYTNIVVSTDIY